MTPCAKSSNRHPPASSKTAETILFPEVRLESTLYTPEQLQSAVFDVPQIALAGRSNAGKSSLINALANRKKLAKISAAPGKTRSLNLYRVLPDNFILTDLPGYGYASRSKQERMVWAGLIAKYLADNPLLAAVCVLIDCRIPPQDSDKAMVRFAIDNRVPLIAVLTKADKCTQRERSAKQREWSAFIPGGLPLPVSSVTGLGIRTLWDMLRSAARAIRPSDGISSQDSASDPACEAAHA
ncbi:MAG: YihA family ribosome biogenesis GTP-binding protein [Mailhella sp.]|nr:YihA family ribosome biogenesis GTP-binding protein [Mailhella sp.]